MLSLFLLKAVDTWHLHKLPHLLLRLPPIKQVLKPQQTTQHSSKFYCKDNQFIAIASMDGMRPNFTDVKKYPHEFGID